MAADIVEMFYHMSGGVPWHETGNEIKTNLSCGEALVKAGGDFPVGTKPLFTATGQEVPAVAIFNEKTNDILGVSGTRYKPYQNEDMVEWFRPFIESGDASFHTGGVLSGGKKVWFLCKLNKDNSVITKDDEVAKFLMLSNAHDGKVAIRVGFTPIRVVCANTLAFAHNSEQSALLRVKHTRKTVANLEAIRDAVNLADETFEMTAEKFRWLATRGCNESDLEKYVKIVLGVENIKTEDLKTRTKNLMENVKGLCRNGMGNDTVGVSGTWWGAYNGVSEWLNHSRGRNENNRLESLWFGQNAGVNQKAFDTALALAS